MGASTTEPYRAKALVETRYRADRQSETDDGLEVVPPLTAIDIDIDIDDLPLSEV